MTVKVGLITPVLYTVIYKDGKIDYDAMAKLDFPPIAIASFKNREKEKTANEGMVCWELLEVSINKFLDSNKITRERLIDIKYQHYGNDDYENNSALVIYESK